MKKITKVLLSLISVILSFTILSGFVDVPKSYWGYNEIMAAQKAKIIEGYGDDSFGPNDPTTKEQMSIILYRVLKERGELKSDEDFSKEYAKTLQTCKISSWAYKEVSYGLKYGLWTKEDFQEKGKASGKSEIGRTMIARWLSNAAGYLKSPLEIIEFTDVLDVAESEDVWLDLVYRYGLMEGGDGLAFMPLKSTSRAEAATVAMRLFKSKISQGTKISNDLSLYYGTASEFDAKRGRFILTFNDGTTKLLRIDSETTIILNGKKSSFADLKGLDGKKITISSIAGDLDVVIIQEGISSFSSEEGVVVKFEKKGDYTLLNVAYGDIIVPFAVTKNNTTYGGTIKLGSRVNVFNDGCELLEVKVL